MPSAVSQTPTPNKKEKDHVRLSLTNLPENAVKIFHRIATKDDKYTKPWYPLLALLITQQQSAFDRSFRHQTEIDIVKLASKAQEILDREPCPLNPHERKGLQGMIIETCFYAYVNIHYQRLYETYIGGQRLDSYTFGWLLVCVLIRNLLFNKDAPLIPFANTQAGPPSSRGVDRAYDEKAARILVCFVCTIICVNEPELCCKSMGKEGKFMSMGENSTGNVAQWSRARENEIAKEILGDLDGMHAFHLKSHFSQFIDEKMHRNKPVTARDSTWKIYPWNTDNMQAFLQPFVVQSDMWLLEEWDEKTFWKLFSPIKDKFVKSPLEWHYIPVRSLVPLSYIGSVLLPHDEPPEVPESHRVPYRSIEAQASPLSDTFQEQIANKVISDSMSTTTTSAGSTTNSPSASSNGEDSSPCEEMTFKPIPSQKLNVCDKGGLFAWIDQVIQLPLGTPTQALPQKRKRNESGTTTEQFDKETTAVSKLFQDTLGLGMRDMTPMKQLFVHARSVFKKKKIEVSKADLPYLFLCVAESWCFVNELFPPTALPEVVNSTMARLRRSMLSHRMVFLELLLTLRLDPLEFWEMLKSKFIKHICPEWPKRLQLHLNDVEEELLSRTIWRSGSSIFTLIAFYEEKMQRKAKFEDSTVEERLEHVIERLLYQGGKRILDISEFHHLSPGVRHGAYDAYRHAVLRFTNHLLKDRHIDQLVISSLHLAGKIYKEEYLKLQGMVDTVAQFKPHLSQLYHQTTFRCIPLVSRAQQIQISWLSSNPEHGSIDKFYNKVFLPNIETIAGTITRLAAPNSHGRSIQDTAIESSAIAPFLASRIMRTSPAKVVSNLLSRMHGSRSNVPSALLSLFSSESAKPPKDQLRSDVNGKRMLIQTLGPLGALACAQLPEHFRAYDGRTIFHFLPDSIFVLDPITKIFKTENASKYK